MEDSTTRVQFKLRKGGDVQEMNKIQLLSTIPFCSRNSAMAYSSTTDNMIV